MATNVSKNEEVEDDSTRKSSTKSSTKESAKKSQRVKILVSVYRVGDKIISALGVPSVEAVVIHKFEKDKIKAEDLFTLSTQLKNHLPYSKLDAYKAVVDQILDEKTKVIVFPGTRANRLQTIGNFDHKILSIEIELFS